MVVALLRTTLNLTRPVSTCAGTHRVKAPLARFSSSTLSRPRSARLSSTSHKLVAFASASMPAKSAVVVWLHGLGDSGAGWSDIEYLLGPKMPHVKWVFPNAPNQPVSCNGGMRMPSWFDIPVIPIGPGCEEAPESFQMAVKSVGAIVDKEAKEAGVSSDRVVLGGFSQGGAIAVQAGLQYPEKLAGAVCFSGWLIDADGVGGRINAANKETPVLWCHGDADPTVTFACQKEGITVLESQGVPLTHKAYGGMGHSACNPEFEDLLAWLKERLPEA